MLVNLRRLAQPSLLPAAFAVCTESKYTFPHCYTSPLQQPAAFGLLGLYQRFTTSPQLADKDAHGETADGKFRGTVVQIIRGRATTISVSGTSSKDYYLTARRFQVSELDGLGKESSKEDFLSFCLRKCQRAIEGTFLPSGYPISTGEKYMEFIVWQGVNSFAVTANTVLASTFMLYSVGLGAGSIATAGALNWILKDGIGQLGTLIFGKTIAHNFDVHSKTWYFLSQLLLKFATGVEILTILCPPYFLIMGSLANTLKGLAWMASGSTRSVFNLSFARDNNIADITAKGTSQYIFASLLGTAAGASMSAYVGQNLNLAILCYSALTAMTLVSAYFTVKNIPLATLNSTRLQLITEDFLRSVSRDRQQQAAHVAELEADEIDHMRGLGRSFGQDRCYVNQHLPYDQVYDDAIEPKIPSPVELTPLDPPLPQFSGMAQKLQPLIHVGTGVLGLVRDHPNNLVMLLNTFKYSMYMIVPRPDGIHVILHQKADSRDIIQAFLQACIVRRRMRDGAVLGEETTAELRITLQDTLCTAERLTTVYMTALEEQGWMLGKIVVEAERMRASW